MVHSLAQEEFLLEERHAQIVQDVEVNNRVDYVGDGYVFVNSEMLSFAEADELGLVYEKPGEQLQFAEPSEAEKK